MYPSTPHESPLSTHTFYILLALVRGDAHGYAIGAMAANHALGSIELADGTLYPLLKRLTAQGLIEDIGLKPAGPSDRKRRHYRLTAEGRLRLAQDVKRMRHAVSVAEHTDLLNGELPPELQRLMAKLN